MMPGYRNPHAVRRALLILFACIGAIIVATLAGFVLLMEADGGEHHGQPVKVYGAGR